MRGYSPLGRVDGLGSALEDGAADVEAVANGAGAEELGFGGLVEEDVGFVVGVDDEHAHLFNGHQAVLFVLGHVLAVGQDDVQSHQEAGYGWFLAAVDGHWCCSSK
jgi:hypothetical protein